MEVDVNLAVPVGWVDGWVGGQVGCIRVWDVSVSVSASLPAYVQNII